MKPCIIQPELLDSVVGSTIRVIPYNNVVVNRHTLLVNFKDSVSAARSARLPLQLLLYQQKTPSAAICNQNTASFLFD